MTPLIAVMVVIAGVAGELLREVVLQRRNVGSLLHSGVDTHYRWWTLSGFIDGEEAAASDLGRRGEATAAELASRFGVHHPQTQGKIERWHQTLKNRILLENYYLPGDLEAQVDAFIAYYNHRRYHESLGNLTPADVYFGRGQTILIEREKIKRQTIKHRRLQHRKSAA